MDKDLSVPLSCVHMAYRKMGLNISSVGEFSVFFVNRCYNLIKIIGRFGRMHPKSYF